MAEDRTDLAEDRTILANERTFAGWVRTGFAAVGIGLGFNALFEKMEPGWIPKTIATAFLLTAVSIFWAAAQSARAVHGRLDAHRVTPFSIRRIYIIAFASISATGALVVAIWLFSGASSPT